MKLGGFVGAHAFDTLSDAVEAIVNDSRWFSRFFHFLFDSISIKYIVVIR